MSWKPKKVKDHWRYTSWGNLEQVDLTEDQLYGPLLNDLLVLLYNL